MSNKNITVSDKSEHILVCLSSAPSNEKIIQTAAKMAKAFNGTFTALYVKTENSENMTNEDKIRLQKNIKLAENSGATITTVYGNDVPFQIAEYARISKVTKIVIGRSSAGFKKIFGKSTLTEQLIDIAPNIDIHIIPDSATNSTKQKSKIFTKHNLISIMRDLIISILVLVIASVLGFGFYKFGFTDANIITIYILGVLITSLISNSKICWIFSAIASVIVFNFLFTIPKFTLLAYDSGYPITFVIMFISSFITGSLASKMKNQAKQSSQAAYRTKILFDTNQLLQKYKTDEEIIDITAKQLKKLLNRSIVIFKPDLTPILYKTDENETLTLDSYEFEIAKWVYSNNKKAGVMTENYKKANFTFFPISINEKIYGVIAIYVKDKFMELFESSIVLSIIGECALILDNSRNLREKEQASLMAKKEQLRANFLRTISHDLRTPLTSISGNANNLMTNADNFDAETKKQIYTDIYDESMWLIGVVENLLSVTRLNEGKMNLNCSIELIDEIISEALRHINRKKIEHKIIVNNNQDLLFVKADARLIVQVIINLVDNAIKYTPSGSTINIVTTKQENNVLISIADNGNGIPDEMKEKVFDMFFTNSNQIVDSRKSLGLGLALCKSIINAHGGDIVLSDNKPSGAIFAFTLPIGGDEIYE